MWLIAIFLSMAHASEVTITREDVRKYECRTACRLGGWDGGTAQGPMCLCFDLVPYEQMTGRKMQTPSKRRVEE